MRFEYTLESSRKQYCWLSISTEVKDVSLSIVSPRKDLLSSVIKSPSLLPIRSQSSAQGTNYSLFTLSISLSLLHFSFHPSFRIPSQVMASIFDLKRASLRHASARLERERGRIKEGENVRTKEKEKCGNVPGQIWGESDRRRRRVRERDLLS